MSIITSTHIPTATQRHRRRIRRLALSACAALPAALGTPGAVDASDVRPHDSSALATCLAGFHTSPDALEGWVDDCRERAVETTAYVACMLQVNASPDALEGWVDHCRERATETAADADVLPS